MTESIELKNVSKPPFFENVSFSLELNGGSIVSVYGSNAQSLTSLLKVISGIDKTENGEILYNGTSSLPVFPFIPKHPSSFPWLSVKGNVENVPDRKKDVMKVITAAGLDGYEDHFPDSKSIGFRFRISLARALSLAPLLILIDDVLDLLDEAGKKEIIFLLKKVSAESNTTFLYAASNITDALQLSNEIVVFNEGKNASAEKFTLSGELKKDLQNILKDVNAG